MSRRRIRDPIHDLIVFPNNREGETLWELLETEPMQRLRRIKQLGFSEFVYPGASHKRLSHSLGAMQMARRMLESFEKRQAIVDFESGSHEDWRLATLCAALIHDIGHGPYSHVFEELSEAQGAKIGHEEYTRLLIENTRISEILKSANIYDKTIYFFSKEKQSSPYGSIISSQLDCDRLDFLARDRYFTGIRSSVIDLEWLFDSLSVQKVYTDVIGDAFEYTLVIDSKGKRVIEEFVNSYHKMYQDVYFHKTTRSMQHLATHAMQKALVELNDEEIKGSKILSVLKKIGGRNADLVEYLALDDSSFTSAIAYLKSLNKGDSAYFATRYLERKPLKCIDTRSLSGSTAKIKALRDELNRKGLWYFLDVFKDKGYKQYSVADSKFTENIIIDFGGEHRRLHEVSKLPEANGHTIRFYFREASDREDAARIMKSL
jgi:uncharacterized protein